MNYAVIEEGLVSNVIWLNDSNADEFPNAVPLGDVPAGIGDTYDGAHFYRDGVIKSINSKYSFDKSLRGTIQRLDGYTPVIFYDFADYITSLCNDPILLNQFREQLNHLVPYKTHTKNFYTMAKGIIPINTFSGITTSDPSDNPMTVLKENTLWYKAAHN